MNIVSKINEDFVQYVWRLKRFNIQNLNTTDGMEIAILSGGLLNHNSGPDFSEARIKIGETLWAGNVEIHIKSSDWIRHNHHIDPAYDNVILHVVYEHDKEVLNSKGYIIPTIELKDRIEPTLYERYIQFRENQDWIPCQRHLDTVDKQRIQLWMYQLVIERLGDKIDKLEEWYTACDGDWNSFYWTIMARYLIGKVNADAAGILMNSIPYQVLLKNQDKLDIIEAILYGQAGMLKAQSETYAVNLNREYEFQKHKYELRQIDLLWKFMRMRPSSFPTIRISQLAMLIHKNGNMFSRILEAEDTKELIKMFDVQASSFWDTHYQFGKQSDDMPKKLGSSTIESLLINVVVPICFMYGKKTNNESFVDKAIDLLASLKPEKNNIISRWKSLGISSVSAADTQALIQLKNEYCTYTKCLNCTIGHQILKDG